MHPLSKVFQRKVEVATGKWRRMKSELPHARLETRGEHTSVKLNPW